MSEVPLLTSDNLDVLIVGGGPVGLLSAIELASRGCKVRIIDTEKKPVNQTKAIGIVCRSMEVLPTPVVERILGNSCNVKRMTLCEADAQGNVSVAFDVPLERQKMYHGIGGMCSQEQWRTESFLTEHMETLPNHEGAARSLKVERGISLLNFTQEVEGVVCEVQNSTGEKECITAKFLLGCDGGRSSIRKKLGFTFRGEATAEYFFAMHARLEGFMGDPSSTNMVLPRTSSGMGAGFAFSQPLPDGGYLLLVDLDDKQQTQWKTEERDRDGLPILRQPCSEDVAGILRQRGLGRDLKVVPESVKWISHFRSQSRQAEHYGQGRVFLAGDACHCHSPLGGQGMNMGFQDSKNISWKLCWAAKGMMPHTILDTYEEERHGLEKTLCGALETIQKTASSRNPIFQFVRGRGQRIGPAILMYTGNIDTPLGYIMQRAWSYSGKKLAYEHWERAPISFASLFPAGGFRRRQNTFRWIGRRCRAGDTVPDAATAEGESLQITMKRGCAWSLLLFQGAPDENEKNSRMQRNVQVLNLGQLHTFGESLKSSADEAGFVSGIDTAIVFPYDDCKEAHDIFGVRGQCLFLVRPDFHIGLRSEPIRSGVVYRYFKEICGMDKPPVKEEGAPRSAMYFDPFPAGLWGTVTVMLGAAWMASSRQSVPLQWAFLTSCVALLFIILASRPPR